ncbi:MAG: hypothetical protein WC399_04395 [Bacilli bacterium]|jgi:hypothetical protein
MTIKVLPKDGPRIRLWLPLGVLKWRVIYRALNKRSKASFDFKDLGELMPRAVKEARRFIRRHGHFNLVEVQSADGTYVLIRL